MMEDTAHAWWSRLRHQGMLLSPVVMLERYADAPQPAPFYVASKLRDARARFLTACDQANGDQQHLERAILTWTDNVLQSYVGHEAARVAKQNSLPEKLTAVIRIGSRSETLKPHRVVFADPLATVPALLVMADPSPHVGRGRGRTTYAQFLELLRATGHRLGLLTNGFQFRLVYAGLDFESWCEWESERWFDDGEGSEELAGLRQLLSPDSLKPVREGISGLLDAIEESRKRQADLSSVLRENVRQAVELLLEEVSASHRTNAALFDRLLHSLSGHELSDAEAHEALLQASVRVVMRLVVCLFAESRQLLPVNDPIYAQSYGVRALYELLEETTRHEGGTGTLLSRNMAWPRLMALFRLIYNGSAHGGFPMRAYGGVLFRPGNDANPDGVSRALHILEHSIGVCDATVYGVLRKLLRGPLPVVKGRTKTFVEGPVDYTDLRTEFIGLIYEGLLDYRLKRTDEQIGPQIFLNLGREPVLPLSRLEDMLKDDPKGLKDLLTMLKKEKVTATVASDEPKEDEEAEAGEEDGEAADQEEVTEAVLENEGSSLPEGRKQGDYLDAVQAAKNWARSAVVLAGLVGKQKAREPDSEYQARVDAEGDRLINRVVSTGEFYLVRAGNTRKGTGTFYTRPQLAVPTVHRTLEPLCYDKAADGTLIPKRPEVILALKICDPSCGSASFLVAALHYLTKALYRSLRQHCDIEDPEQAQRITLPFGRARTSKDAEELVPFPPNDPERGHLFEDRVSALLRRHVVERCIYGVDINPLAVELARVSLWVETLDDRLPFSFLDHKLRVGNSLVGCWLDRVLDYPLKAWEREGGDGKDGPRTDRIDTLLKGPKENGGRRSGDGVIKKEMRQLITTNFDASPRLFDDKSATVEQVVVASRIIYDGIHAMAAHDVERREEIYRDQIVNSQPLNNLKRALDEWCAVWFWPTDEESIKHAPTPLTFHCSTPERERIVKQVCNDLKFFHWEVAFPDVFTPKRWGFDATIGNPPWDVAKPNSQEFFTEFDPLYRTYDKQHALRRQKAMFESEPTTLEKWEAYVGQFKALSNYVSSAHDPFDLALARGKEGNALAKAFAKHRAKLDDSRQKPFRIQGSADVNLYKLFAEFFWTLLATNGRMGVLLPTGLYSDFGTRDFREELLLRGNLELLYAFQNEKRAFAAAHHSFKQTVVVATRGGGPTQPFLARFRMGVGDSPHAQEMEADILRSDDKAMRFTLEDVRLNSPKTLSLVELRSLRDAEVFRKIYSHSIRLGDNAPGWKVEYAREFDMTNDSKLFPPREQWETKGYKPDPFGRWIGPEGDVALPFFQGVSVNQFDIAQKGWLSGLGRSALWKAIPHDAKRFEPKYLMGERSLRAAPKYFSGPKLGHRRVARSTDTRTAIGCAVVGFGCSDKLATLIINGGDLRSTLVTGCVFDSLAFDWMTRLKIGGSLDWNLIEQLPVPPAISATDLTSLAISCARLTYLHRRFAPEWLKLRAAHPELEAQAWKYWWAVTEADRLRLRVQIDSLVAGLYGLSPDDLDWIVREDPNDPKGFYRVDRNLPFRERLTGLAATAFRSLAEGKWSADSAAKLSNDEFFEILGIPELTNERAAKAKGLDRPLIYKRDGCHVWEPEKFTKDDPRYGWTWEHCWNDAVALLGSDEAVQAYIDQKPVVTESGAQPNEGAVATDLYGQPLPTDLFGNEVASKRRKK